MVSSIDSLRNMEYMLYGGASGWNANCPSYSNGYMANQTAFRGSYPYNSYYNNSYAPADNTRVANNYTQDIFAPQNTNQVGQTNFGASASDLDVLGKYYLKGQAPSESLTSATVGGAAFTLLTNLRLLAHPINSFSTLGRVEKMFADVKKDGSALNKLWSNPDSHKIMTNAYHKMHKLEGASKSRLGMFKARLDENVYKTLKAEMESALKSGNKEKIAIVTEKIRIATGAQTGWLPRAWKKLWGSEAVDVSKKIAEDTAIKSAATKNVTEAASKTLTEHLKHGFKGQAGWGGALFGAMEFAMDFGKIKSAFSKDSTTGMKQIGQTSVKAAGSIIGWTAGEAVGAWAGAKLGAMAGTAIAPGVGTVIGAIAGMVGGSIGCAIMGKITHSFLGDDVGAKVEVENMKKTTQGQAQLLELTATQAQQDKKLDTKVAQALQNVATVYGVA